MAFLTTEGTEYLIGKLCDSKNIKITGNKHGNRVNAVIDNIVKKADDVTKSVEQEINNDYYTFKAGSGDVNVSSDVEDGFTEMSIKGVTYQNLIGKVDNVASRWVDHGDKYSLDLPVGNGQPGIFYSLSQPLKRSTTYTFIVEITDYTVGYPHFNLMTKDKRTAATTTEYSPSSAGIKVFTLTTKSDVDAGVMRIIPRSRHENNYSISKRFIILEGDHKKSNLPISYFENIIGVGDKSKNLLSGRPQGNGWINPATGEIVQSITNLYYDFIPVDGDSTVVLSSQKKVTGGIIGQYDKDRVFITAIDNVLPNKVKLAHNTRYVRVSVNFGEMVNQTLSKNAGLQLEVGTSSTAYEPYYTGHKIKISSTGKNLYDMHNDISLTFGISEIKNGIFRTKALVNYEVFSLVNNIYTANNRIYDKPTRIVKGKKYSISCKVRKVSGEGNLNYFAFFGFNKGSNKYTVFGLSYTGLGNNNLTNEWMELKYTGTSIDNFDTACPCFQVANNINNLILEVKDVQIEESDTPTSYEPFKSDKMEILIDEPLMRLPNGTYDEITRDGKLIRRIGKMVLDGSEPWARGGFSNSDRQELYISPEKIIPAARKRGNSVSSYNNFVCDRFPTMNGVVTTTNKWFAINGAGGLTMTLPCTELTEPYYEKAKEWISKNPITLYYELAEPVVTQLPESQMRIFKNGHLRFDTMVAPISSHTVQLNKSAQIERSVREVNSLDNKVSKLEALYDDLLLSTSVNIDLLGLDYNLEMGDE